MGRCRLGGMFSWLLVSRSRFGSGRVVEGEMKKSSGRCVVRVSVRMHVCVCVCGVLCVV